MLASSHRLTASSDIENVIVHGARQKAGNVLLYATPSPLKQLRIACVAGKKVHAHATVRHQIQRKLRAAVAQLIPALSAYDIVVVALHADVRSMKPKDIAQDILDGLGKMGVVQ